MITADTKAALKKMQAKTSLKKNPDSYAIGESYIADVWKKQTVTDAKRILTNGEISEEWDWFNPDGTVADRDRWGDLRASAIRKKVKRLRHLGQVDTLVGVGMSGSLLVPRLADALGIEALVLRKPGVNTHASSVAEGHLGSRWVFVDDFISSGETLRRAYGLVNELAEKYDIKTEFAGAYLYRNDHKLKEPEELFEDYRLAKDGKTNIMHEILYGKRN